MKTNSLDSFQLFYEETERKKVNTSGKTTATSAVKHKASPKKPLKALVFDKLAPVVTRLNSVINNVAKKLKHPRKKAKKTTKTEQKAMRAQQYRGILGIGTLLVVVSIIYSTSVILTGVDGPVSKLILLPQALFALVSLLKAFSKIYK